MSGPDPVLDATRQWLRYARADLAEAQINIAHGGSPNIACFHAQQAAEKAIKAAYVWAGADFERLHDLDRLRNLLPGEWSFRAAYPDLAALTYWAVQGRYPGLAPEPTGEDAADALSTAQQLLANVVDDLRSRGFTE